MSEHTITLTDANWEQEVIASPQPVLVDFWAEWCAPCRSLAPTIDALAAEMSGRLRVGKLNVEENPQVAMRYGITNLPTLLLLKGGQVREQRMGLISKDKLVQLVTPQLA
ncbi:MAG: thioredoxin [Vicinamibacteria bacterium]|jgi:thioredoxin 1|nr:thioredoxin [Vicinamibacteria bacterium]